MELAMKIRDFIQRGRELYVQCHGRHPGIISAPRRVPLELSQFDPDLDVEDLKGRLRCSVRGTTDPRKILADLTKSLEINPKDIWTYAMRARAFNETGHRDRASSDRRTLLTLPATTPEEREMPKDARWNLRMEEVGRLQVRGISLSEAMRETESFDPLAAPTPSAPERAEKAAPNEIPLQKKNGVFVLSMTVNDAVLVEFVLDSGAAEVTLPADIVASLKRQSAFADSDFIGQQAYQLADGSPKIARTFRIRSLSFGAFHLNDVTGSELDVGSPALLGQSFLNRLGKWSIDNSKPALIIQPPTEAEQ
jgi:predicted aspartyl protease